MAAAVGANYFAWPRLPDLLPTAFPGVKTSRDDFLVSIDHATLERRLREYFDARVKDEEIGAKYPVVMAPSGRFDPADTRQVLLRRGFLQNNIVGYAYRPFDVRWLYWEPETKLLDERRSEYWPHVRSGN